MLCDVITHAAVWFGWSKTSMPSLCAPKIDGDPKQRVDVSWVNWFYLILVISMKKFRNRWKLTQALDAKRAKRVAQFLKIKRKKSHLLSWNLLNHRRDYIAVHLYFSTSKGHNSTLIGIWKFFSSSVRKNDDPWVMSNMQTMGKIIHFCRGHGNWAINDPLNGI